MAKRFDRRSLEPEPDSYVVITKLNAARRQLETGIQLWFQDGDPVSIHTLVSAAMGILVPIAEEKKTWKGTYDTSGIRPGMEEEYLAWMKVHQNFFKHGSKDPHSSIKFNPQANFGEIRVAIEVYRLISPDLGSPLAAAFSLLFFLKQPEIHSANLFSSISPTMRARLLALPKKEFLAQAMRLIDAGLGTKEQAR